MPRPYGYAAPVVSAAGSPDLPRYSFHESLPSGHTISVDLLKYHSSGHHFILSLRGFVLFNFPIGDHGGTGGPFRSEHREKGRGPVNGVERCRLLPGRKHRAVARCARLRGLTHQNNVTLRTAKWHTRYQRGSQSKSIERNGMSNGSDLERLVRGENGASGPTLPSVHFRTSSLELCP